MSHIKAMSTYGEFSHTYDQLSIWFMLMFFTFSYVLIDEGLQLVNAEVRNYMQMRRAQIAKAARRQLRNDVTLSRERYSTVVCKFLSLSYFLWLDSGFAFS